MSLRVLLIDKAPVSSGGLLIDKERGRSALLEQALQDLGYEVVARLHSEHDLYDKVGMLNPDIIIIDIQSPDRDTLESMRTISQDMPRPIVMFAEKSDSGLIEASVRAGVSAYVVDGLAAGRLKPIMDVAIARFREFHALRTELDKMRVQLEDRKYIDKAKGLLMKKRGISEEEAYHSLRKLAMDRNKRIGEMARDLIALMDVLG